ncbi:hypothetical protein Anapl_09948 [Anas platyrhynchos]|uniref:Uncharacterized protein n=1 Tax=Anas platyrhynchos TaxID=8839 RepID=R0M8J9_ANAPL|nr:hypothetical protein Anapl_09948 [Anas platyrhynchos]
MILRAAVGELPSPDVIVALQGTLLPCCRVRRECEWGFMFAHLRDQQTHFPVTLGRALPPVALFTQKQRVPACKSQR